MSEPSSDDRVWTVHDGGQQHGPYSERELATSVAAGTTSAAALAWREGLPQWVPVSSVVRTPPPVPPVTQYRQPHYPYPHAPQPTPPETSRVTAGVLGILLGGLGIHKFVLGYTGAGMIMLLVSVLTCGFGYFVMGIIGLVEGIVYLAKSEAEFHHTYVANKREWF